ncbi:MAG: M56 family metallopeptidase [bacterium]
MLYAIYRGKGNFFVLNRSYLLFGVVAALLLPLVNYDLLAFITQRKSIEGYVIAYPLTSFQLPEISVGRQAPEYPDLNIWQVISGVYVTGIVAGMAFFLYRMLQLFRLVMQKEQLTIGGLKVYFTPGDWPVFSFFNKIFISREVYESDASQTILAHEKVHVRQMHSVDLMLAEVLCIILWFNPFAYFIKKAIRENHEFLADEAATAGIKNISDYRLMLLAHSSMVHTNSLAHNFSYSLLKRRLHMMKKPKKILHLSLSIMAITLALSMILIACSQPDSMSAGVDDNALAGEEILTEAETMPEFPGGIQALMSFLAENIKYPETAKANKTEGKVMVNFVVNKAGSVTEVEAVKGIGDGCDEEAVRVVKMLPDWTPGYNDGKAVNVSFNLPVLFRLGESDSVYRVVQTMPEFPGGTQALLNYVAQNIQYPEEAKRDSIQGKVFVQFVVEKDGSVSGAKILRGVGGGCDKESLRVVSSMPDWKPGLDEDGKPVRVEYTLPIKYALN